MADSTIQVLSQHTINQIAAGELIENPASVVKELIENALDANSSSIIVEIKGGGFGLIRVSDDGKGMGRSDLELCLERFATSKIQESADLNTVLSMGFRGEALASIGAVAKVQVTSSLKQEGNQVGGRVLIEGGELKGREDAAHKGGTTVEVTSLFYNVPARKKFQKSASVNQAHIVKTFTQLVLAYPKVHFKLLVNGQTLLNVRTNKTESFLNILKEAISAVLDQHFLNRATVVDREENRCRLLGYIGSPGCARPNRLGQYLFINNRRVLCPQISYALYDGYGTRLMAQRHPIFVLHLTLPPEWVDVNVHPQKKEVRLREERVIKDFVRRAVVQSLQGETTPLMGEGGTKIEGAERGKFSGHWAQAPFPDLQLREQPSTPSPLLCLQSEQQDFPVVGLFSTYLLLAGGDRRIQIPQNQGPYEGLLFVDLVAAQAQIAYEAFLNHTKEKKERQILMIPLIIELAPHESPQLMLYLETIKALGIEVCLFGENTFLIDAIDPRLVEDQIKPLILELIGVLDRFSDDKYLQKEREKKLALSLSCYATSQKKRWSLVEAKQVLRKLLSTSSPYLSPKGRAIISHLEPKKIETLFS